VVWAFIGSALAVHFRGKVRLGFWRQFSDHSTIMAPYNVLMYLFSAVPNRPILDENAIPELKVLRDNWQPIREEALVLFAQVGFIVHLISFLDSVIGRQQAAIAVAL
jgi:beta-hydroxylase